MANYIKAITYSVDVSLDALQKHLDNQLRDILLQELHVDSLAKACVQVSYETDGIMFYAMEVTK